ncbi:MAG: hypothetical protein WCD79_23755 [Chthoniobacteraceae bacterium]
MKRLTTGNMVGSRDIKRPAQPKKSGINQALKAAYGLYFRDKYTRLAVRRCLG